MKAALLESVGQLVLTDVDAPVIGGMDQVLVQVKCVGICGSEVHAFEGTHPYRKPPTILGHEAAGVITAVSPNVTQFQPGDRVIIDPQWTCGECQYCQSGDINLCPHKKVMGTPDWPGAFSQYVIAPVESVFPLPEHLSFAQGAMIEPLTVAVHVAKRAGLKAGESVAILGTGSIGGMVSGVCRAQGATLIITADIRQHCLDAARERMGATHDILLPDNDLVAQVKEITNGEGVDVAFITADDPELVSQAVELVKCRGRIVLVAILTEAPLNLWAYNIIGQEKQIIGSNMSTHTDVLEAIELAATGQVDVEGIVTHTLPLTAAQRGMKMAQTKDNEAIKVILAMPENQ